jgi:hypothetical protein
VWGGPEVASEKQGLSSFQPLSLSLSLSPLGLSLAHFFSLSLSFFVSIPFSLSESLFCSLKKNGWTC